MEPQVVYFGAPGSKIEAVSIQEGDTVVFSTSIPLTAETGAKFRERCEEIIRSIGFTDVRVICLGSEATLTVLPRKAA